MKITRFVTGPLSVNTWCVPLDSRRIMVVDPGGSADLIIAHLAELGAQLSLVLLTHGHFDHIAALLALIRAFPSAEIAIHREDAHSLGEGALERHYSFFEEIGAGSVIRRYRDALPAATRLIAEGDEFDGWRVLHTPGHSPGSVCLYNGAESTLLSGDTLFNAGQGRTDTPGGDEDAMSRSLARLSALPPETAVLPGHGPATTIEREF